MTAAARATRAAPERAARRPAITGGPRCGWPGHKCAAPDDWHAPPPGTRRPWGWHDTQCQTAATDPDLYPQCGLISDHAGPCAYTSRPERLS